MKKEIFNRIVDQTKEGMKSIWLEEEKHALNEQAVPSYLNSNKIVSKVFWDRIRIIIEEIEKEKPEVVLDFGCGVGTLFLFFQELGIKKVIAYDNEKQAINGSKKLLEKYNINNIKLINSVEDFENLDRENIDAITALDVLEHITKIDDILDNFYRILKVSGTLYVSGPTENGLYRLSRKFGGSHYKNHFHVSNIYEIEEKINDRFDFKLIKRIWPIFTFFRLSKAVKK